MTTQTSDAERQLDWEARTGWLYEEGKSLDRGVVSWVTGRRQSAADTWPQLTAWEGTVLATGSTTQQLTITLATVTSPTASFTSAGPTP